jgi:hypothetical protein
VSLTDPAHCPHNSRTFAELRVRALCTRAARGCPAGLPGRAKGAAQTVPDLTPHPGTPGEARSGTQQSASGQASRAAGGNQRGNPSPKPQGFPRWFPPHPPSLSPLLAHPRSPQHRHAPSSRGTNRRHRHTPYRRPAASSAALRATSHPAPASPKLARNTNTAGRNHSTGRHHASEEQLTR